MPRDSQSTPTSRRRFLTQAAAFGALGAGSLAGPRRCGGGLRASHSLPRRVVAGVVQWHVREALRAAREGPDRVEAGSLVRAAGHRPAPPPPVGSDPREPEHLQPARRHGAVVEWTEERIPNLKQIHPAFRYPYLAGKIHTPYGLAVNTKRIKKPVTRWADLWDPAFDGKVASRRGTGSARRSSTPSTAGGRRARERRSRHPRLKELYSSTRPSPSTTSSTRASCWSPRRSGSARISAPAPRRRRPPGRPSSS